MTFITHLLRGLGHLTSIMAVKQVDGNVSGRQAIRQSIKFNAAPGTR